MKKILFIIGFGFVANAVDGQEVRDVKRNIIAHITQGKIMDKDKNTLYVFKEDERIVDMQANTLGFFNGKIDRWELLDKERKLVAYYKSGSIYNAQDQMIGSINSTSGPVIKNGNVIATIDVVEPVWAAAYFFLLKQ